MQFTNLILSVFALAAVSVTANPAPAAGTAAPAPSGVTNFVKAPTSEADALRICTGSWCSPLCYDNGYAYWACDG